MEVLGWMVEVVVGGDFIIGFLVGNAIDGFITLSHLLFVDDTYIFYDADQGNIQSLRFVLLCFEARISFGGGGGQH